MVRGGGEKVHAVWINEQSEIIDDRSFGINQLRPVFLDPIGAGGKSDEMI